MVVVQIHVTKIITNSRVIPVYNLTLHLTAELKIMIEICLYRDLIIPQTLDPLRMIYHQTMVNLQEIKAQNIRYRVPRCCVNASYTNITFILYFVSHSLEFYFFLPFSRLFHSLPLALDCITFNLTAYLRMF